MAYTTVHNNVYNYYLSTYGSKEVSRHDATHKKSELRDLYNSMLKLNKESPLYLIPNAKQAAQSAIGFKEMARSLRSDIASLGGLNQNELLNQKSAFSTDQTVATATYIGENPSEASTLSMEVRNLATPQTNLGEFLNSDAAVGLPENTYSFDINIRGLNYEFQFNIHKGETNKDVQNRLSRLINHSGIGLTSKLIEGDGSHSALQISSEATGRPENASLIFNITDNATSKASGAVDYFGLGYTAVEPVDAIVAINGEAYSSNTNDVVFDDYEISLKGISPEDGQPTTIGLKNDFESLTDNMKQLFGSYNAFIKAASEYQADADTSRFNSGRFQNELASITNMYQEELNNIGVRVEEDGTISLDEQAIEESAGDASAQDRFQVVKDFAKQLVRKTDQISLDPMQYTTKKIVAYKNPGHNFTSPYVTSNYSGMLFSYRC